MAYCHVSAQIDQNQKALDKKDALDEAIETRADQIVEELLLEGDSPIDEKVAEFADEEGEIFNLLHAAFAEGGSREDRKESLMKKMEVFYETVQKFAEEEAEKDIKG